VVVFIICPPQLVDQSSEVGIGERSRFAGSFSHSFGPAYLLAQFLLALIIELFTLIICSHLQEMHFDHLLLMC
jgi:hypothetical protein